MNCAVHPDREASGYCRNCGKAMCGECSHKVRDVLYCEDCLAQHVGLPPATPVVPAANAAPTSPAAAGLAGKHGGPVVAFLLGLIPGLGAVYNGEYNKAILHIVIFGCIIFGLASDLGDNMQAFLVLLVCIFPFYMAIDAMRVAKAKQTGEQLSDPLEDWSSKRPLGPMILIALGALFLMNNFGLFDFFRVKQLFVPLLLIGAGIFMLRNRLGGEN
jgi:Domain of unknown function (DUF5668)/B-box zinc finger